MGRLPKLVCCWPGLPQLWLGGSWSGLALAVGFGVLLNLMLLGSLVWTAWFSPRLLASGWGAVLALWAAAGWISLRSRAFLPPQARETPAEPKYDLLGQAQIHYLQESWLEAESLLEQLVRRNRHDAEARLALATMKRRQGEFDAAISRLDDLERLDAAAGWMQEIVRERALVERDRAENEAEGGPQAEQLGPADVEPSIEPEPAEDLARAA